MARATSEAVRTTQTLSQHHRARLKWCRKLSTQHAVAPAKEDLPSKTQPSRETRRKTADRHLFLDVLSANASKRDARSYLANFTPVPRPKFRHPVGVESSASSGAPTAATTSQNNDTAASNALQGEKPASPIKKNAIEAWVEPLRTALVLLKLDDSLREDTLESLGHTLSQLSRLGMNPVVVVQPPISDRNDNHEVRKQVNRVVTAIEKTEGQRAQGIENGLVVDGNADSTQEHNQHRSKIRLSNRKTLMSPIDRSIIPVIAPLGFNSATGSLDVVPSADAMLALVRNFTGLDQCSNETSSKDQLRISLDRLIVLDPNGGIPRSNRASESHLFVNLEQEFDDISTELKTDKLPEHASRAHLENIKLARDALDLLPPTSSAVISSHSAAAGSARKSSVRSRNPLIHNLLTDKPLFSSSLPQSRLSDPTSLMPSPPTLLKRGMPVTILPSPRLQQWEPPSTSSSPLSLQDSALDLTRLVELIEDSFGRPLDAQAYFARIAPVLAGVVIAGQYDGCAILTWEPVPNSPTAAPVPYLDKLAVKRASQGAGGVADIIFNAMVRDCFPQGVVWRSRTVNPVNGWYFERARGSWRLPYPASGSHWTMFWTTGAVDSKRFGEYASVCGGLGHYWRDGKGAD